MSEGEIVILSVGISVGIGCFAAAIACWWKGVKARYDATFVEPFVNGEPTSKFDEKALRRMMKQTAKEMDWTEVKWG